MSILSPFERPIVHIGYHKTATSWFQKRVWPAAFSHHFVPREITRRALLGPPAMHFDPVAAAELLELERRDRTVLLSDESLSGSIHNGGLHGLVGPEMARRIHQVMPDALIVIFIRNQRDMIRAAFARYVLDGGTCDLERYLEGRGARGQSGPGWEAPAFEWEHLEYDRLIACYDRLFGRESVFVYPYEWLTERPRLLNMLSSDLGLALHQLPALKEDKPRSLGPVALRILRFINLFTPASVNPAGHVVPPGPGRLGRAARSLLSVFSSGEHHLPAGLAQRIDRFYAASNHRLLTSRDLPLEELGYPIAVALAEKAAHGAIRTVA